MAQIAKVGKIQIWRYNTPAIRRPNWPFAIWLRRTRGLGDTKAFGGTAGVQIRRRIYWLAVW